MPLRRIVLLFLSPMGIYYFGSGSGYHKWEVCGRDHRAQLKLWPQCCVVLMSLIFYYTNLRRMKYQKVCQVPTILKTQNMAQGACSELPNMLVVPDVSRQKSILSTKPSLRCLYLQLWIFNSLSNLVESNLLAGNKSLL